MVIYLPLRLNSKSKVIPCIGKSNSFFRFLQFTRLTLNEICSRIWIEKYSRPCWMQWHTPDQSNMRESIKHQSTPRQPVINEHLYLVLIYFSRSIPCTYLFTNIKNMCVMRVSAHFGCGVVRLITANVPSGNVQTQCVGYAPVRNRPNILFCMFWLLVAIKK